MTNVIAGPHVYNYQSNYSTDPAANAANVQGMIGATQRLRSADGVMPVIIDEFGDSTAGDARDSGGLQNVQSVLKSGVGYAAWNWTDSGGDVLRNADGSLTDYGQMVASAIQAGGPAPGCAQSPIAIPDLTQTNPAGSNNAPDQAAGNTPAQQSVVSLSPVQAGAIAPGQGSVTDAYGNVWTISASGSIRMGDQWVAGGGGTSALTIVNGVVYGQDNGHGPVNPGGWFTLSANGRYWTPSAPPPPSAATPVTAPALAAIGQITAPDLASSPTTVTAPPLPAGAMTVEQVAKLAETPP